jgi:hypothetical protein
MAAVQRMVGKILDARRSAATRLMSNSRKDVIMRDEDGTVLGASKTIRTG